MACGGLGRPPAGCRGGRCAGGAQPCRCADRPRCAQDESIARRVTPRPEDGLSPRWSPRQDRSSCQPRLTCRGALPAATTTTASATPRVTWTSRRCRPATRRVERPAESVRPQPVFTSLGHPVRLPAAGTIRRGRPISTLASRGRSARPSGEREQRPCSSDSGSNDRRLNVAAALPRWHALSAFCLAHDGLGHALAQGPVVSPARNPDRRTGSGRASPRRPRDSPCDGAEKCVERGIQVTIPSVRAPLSRVGFSVPLHLHRTCAC